MEAEPLGHPWKSPGKLEGEGPVCREVEDKGAFADFGLEFPEEPGVELGVWEK